MQNDRISGRDELFVSSSQGDGYKGALATNEREYLYAGEDRQDESKDRDSIERGYQLQECIPPRMQFANCGRSWRRHVRVCGLAAMWLHSRLARIVPAAWAAIPCYLLTSL